MPNCGLTSSTKGLGPKHFALYLSTSHSRDPGSAPVCTSCIIIYISQFILAVACVLKSWSTVHAWRVQGGAPVAHPQLWHNSQISSSVATIYADNRQ